MQQQRREVEIYEQKTNKDVTVHAKNSQSLSGVDQYQYSYLTEGNSTWSEWKDCTQTEIIEGKETIVGKFIISEHGKTIVKVRGISQLTDGTIVGEESQELIVNIDKKGPQITFSNIENGSNGDSKTKSSAKVRVTVTDQDEITVNENTLKYEWILFDSTEEYESFAKQATTLEKRKEKMTEQAKVFANGEPIVTEESMEGIYSLFIYAQDALGNESIEFSNYYRIGKEDLEQQDYMIGDLNGDKQVDIIDLAKMKRYIIGLEDLEETYKKAADINRDGEIDIIDLVKIKQIISGIITQ